MPTTEGKDPRKRHRKTEKTPPPSTGLMAVPEGLTLTPETYTLLREALPPQGTLCAVFITGTFGSGKTEIRNRLIEKAADLPLYLFPKTATRYPRPGETDQSNVRFVSAPTFREMVASGQFVNWNQIPGVGYYGQEVDLVVDALKQKRVMVFDLTPINAAGLMEIFQKLGIGYLTFFLSPADREMLQTEQGLEHAYEEICRRISGRRAEGSHTLRRSTRLDIARSWCTAPTEIGQHIHIVNAIDNQDQAARTIADFIRYALTSNGNESGTASLTEMPTSSTTTRRRTADSN